MPRLGSSLPPLVVLAGGFGTRLRSVLSGVPKPLAPVAGRPFLSYLLDQWIEAGVNDFVFLLHHEADQISGFLANYRHSDSRQIIKIRCVVEPTPMGTGGAVTWACSETELPDEILIANGDTWVPGGVAALRNEAANCLASVRVPNSSRYGRLIVDNGLVVGFLEKESTGEEGLISAGIYRLETRYFRAQPLGSPFSLERTILKDLTVSAQLGCALCPGDFIDIGIPEDYQKFSMQIEGRLTSERGS